MLTFLIRMRRFGYGGLAVVATLLLSLAWPLPAGTKVGEGITSLRVTDRDGALLRELYPEGRGHPVELGAVNPAVIEALIATEDRRFYSHPGVDPLALGRAVVQNVRAGRVISGGSTLTMQVARAIRPTSSRGLGAKLVEAHLALRLELRLSKDEIIALWLNRVPFGNRAHGIEAAAQTYFGKSAVDLTIDEATLLVGLPQAPSRLDPFRHIERALERRERVLDAMHRVGAIDPGERDRLARQTPTLIEARRAFSAPHFVEWVARTAPRGTAEIRTTLDESLQIEVERIVRSHVGSLRGHSVSAGAAVVVDNATGAVLAYVGSPEFWDYRAAGQVDGVQALRQPGSALKPFTYGLALESGLGSGSDDGRWTPATIIPDLDLQVLEAGGAFSPENYDRQFHGPVSVRTALASSLNVPAVRVARTLGTDALLEAMHSAGFASLRQSAEHYGVGLTLGSGEVRLIELARAFAGLARGGAMPEIQPTQWIATAGGDTLRASIPTPRQNSLSPATSYLITDILADPEARAIGFGRGGPLELPFPAAVKTGTTKDYRDNWAVGYTPRHTVAVWIGNFDNSPMQWVSGIRGTGPMLNAILSRLGSSGQFSRPSGIVTAEICPASGARPGAYCPGTRRELFLDGTTPDDSCTVHRMIQIDQRTGLLADGETPTVEVERRLYSVYPPEYHAWMRSRGMPVPPTVSTVVSAGGELRTSARLRIDFPGHGSVFHLDPVLRRDFQQVRLRGAADEDLLDVAWYINGERFPGDIHEANWPLSPGAHTLELRALTHEGRRLRSIPAIITVRGGEPVAHFAPE